MDSNLSQLERNLEIVLEILPRGVLFAALSQERAYLAHSHVIVYVRLTQEGRTPSRCPSSSTARA